MTIIKTRSLKFKREFVRVGRDRNGFAKHIIIKDEDGHRNHASGFPMKIAVIITLWFINCGIAYWNLRRVYIRAFGHPWSNWDRCIHLAVSTLGPVALLASILLSVLIDGDSKKKAD